MAMEMQRSGQAKLVWQPKPGVVVMIPKTSERVMRDWEPDEAA